MNNTNMETIHNEMSRHVVTIKIKVELGDENDVDKYDKYDGTVLSSLRDSLYMIVSSKLKDKIDIYPMHVQLPNGRRITIGRDCFDMVDEDTGIIGIRCTNPTPGIECGFGDLEPITICVDPVQEQQEVYTYSHHFKEKLLTLGSVMLVEDNSFDHSCARFTHTHQGTPVLNIPGHLIGFNFSHNGYLTSYNLREVAARIERNQGRDFTNISETFQHLRQQCRVLQFRHEGGRVASVRIQWVGQPEHEASWENLYQFLQQHPVFKLDEETEQQIQQKIWAHRYVRQRNRRIQRRRQPVGRGGVSSP